MAHKKSLAFWKLCLLFLFIGCNKDGEESLPKIQVPSVVTSEAANITENSATIEGNITDDGGSSIIEKGVCWATINNPTREDSHTENGGGKGMFSNQLIDLEENTTYYARAYASNEEGTAYGNEISFTTLDLPILIYDGNVELLSQDMVDDFGNEMYTEITGNLTISYDPNHPEWEPVNNLDKLANLTKINGELLIGGLTNLSNADGLANVSEIGGNIEVRHSQMTSLTWLKEIKEFNGSLILSDLSGLQSLEGLENCTAINQGLDISFNPGLININALKNLSSIGLFARIDYNDKLPDIDGLSGLNEIGGYLSIYKNDLITDITGLKNLVKVGSTFSIEKCPQLTNIDGLDNLNLVETIEINENDALTNLDGLEHVISVNGIQGSLLIRNNNALVDINVLTFNTEGIKSIEIKSNAALENLSGLNGLKSIQSLTIENNSSLTEIAGLNNLQSVTQGLTISNNNKLISIHGFEGITSFDGKLKIWYNKILSNLCGLSHFIENGLVETNYQISGNQYNPSYQDLIDGNCSN
ncbi:MAG: hypothetical protein RLO17_17330 [Cyclobacteriaceae bacterium]